MAQFYGVVVGGKGEATRLGTKNSGLLTRAAAWGGAIVVDVSYDIEKEQDRFVVRMEQHEGQGDYRVIASGIMGNASTLKLGAPIKPLNATEAELVQLARNAGATGGDVNHPDQPIVFTAQALREYTRQIMAHEALASK